MYGIILAGGKATRLYPITKSVNKHLLPIYNKPMIYYSLSTLIYAGIRDILLITSPDDIIDFQNLLGNGKQFGLNIEYLIQEKPGGIAESFIIAENYINDNICLVLGDNVFHSENLEYTLMNARTSIEKDNKAVVFGYHVKDPERYGVLEFDNAGNPVNIIEKPKQPKSNYAIMGLYFYPKSVVEVAKALKPSSRGELEISDINKYYLDQKQLSVHLLKEGFAWLDTGTYDSLIQASNFIQILEQRQNILVGSIEEAAYRKGFINNEQLDILAHNYHNTPYGETLKYYLYENS